MFGSAAVSTPTLPLVFQPPGGKCETKTVLPLFTTSADSPAASLQAAQDLCLRSQQMSAATCSLTPVQPPNLADCCLKNS